MSEWIPIGIHSDLFHDKYPDKDNFDSNFKKMSKQYVRSKSGYKMF